MALVRNDQPNSRQGRKERRARPDDHLKQAQTGAPPGVVTLAGGQARVDESHLPGKTRQKAAHHLRSDGNFRDKDDGLPAAPDGFGGRTQIDFGFA